MAHHKSAWKRHLQSRKRRAKNRIMKASMRTQVKKARATIDEGKADPNAGDVRDAVKHLAALGRKRILHPRTAARRISRLMKQAAKKS